MTRVLIAVDGSAESNDAARFAHRVFGDHADYLVLTVADAGAYIGGELPLADPTFSGGGVYISPDAAREGVEIAVHDAEETAADVASSVDAHAESIAEIGEPGDTICRVAEERSVDLIVIGSHDRGWFSRLLTPSVQKHVLDHAPCPVLVVR